MIPRLLLGCLLAQQPNMPNKSSLTTRQKDIAVEIEHQEIFGGEISVSFELCPNLTLAEFIEKLVEQARVRNNLALIPATVLAAYISIQKGCSTIKPEAVHDAIIYSLEQLLQDMADNNMGIQKDLQSNVSDTSVYDPLSFQRLVELIGKRIEVIGKLSDQSAPPPDMLNTSNIDESELTLVSWAKSIFRKVDNLEKTSKKILDIQQKLQAELLDEEEYLDEEYEQEDDEGCPFEETE